MKVYRGYKTVPKFFVPNLASELKALNEKAKLVPTGGIGKNLG